jgi:hypothetical protein
VACVIEVFSRSIVDWRVSSSLKVELVLDPLKHPLHARSDSDELVDAFAIPKRRTLQFAATDRVRAIHRGLYPLTGWPDAPESEN